MLRTKTLILSTHENQEVGSEIYDILRRDESLIVKHFSGRLSDAKLAHNEKPQLLIAVAPTANPDTAAFFRELRSLEFGTSLLYVLTPDLLNDAESLEKSQDFLISPFNETELMFRVRRLINSSHRSSAIREAAEACGLAQILGEDPKLVNLKRRIPIVARFDSTVLLTGETGTGKERFARALHYSSPRASKPFLPVNCGAIPVELFESELYGHR
ncbi:MAG TPA: sigma 54-interacting transcriptional regulator, partial [Pyrinomonadaceae bacterium]|nr:sigma 54-interacting transcriptional regulator [Pyrinomonadaceae bacterium]